MNIDAVSRIPPPILSRPSRLSTLQSNSPSQNTKTQANNTLVQDSVNISPQGLARFNELKTMNDMRQTPSTPNRDDTSDSTFNSGPRELPPPKEAHLNLGKICEGAEAFFEKSDFEEEDQREDTSTIVRIGNRDYVR